MTRARTDSRMPALRPNLLGEERRRLVLAGSIVVALVAVSSVVYYLLGAGRWEMIDCVYMTLVTLSTVGFNEVLPVDEVAGAKVFTMVLLVVGIGTVTWFLSSVTAFVVGGDLQAIIGRRRMEKRIARISGHIIVLGVGRTGEYAVSQFVKGAHPVVQVDRDEDHVRALFVQLGQELPYVVGDATSELALREAGIERAFGLVCAMDSDQANLYAVLTARQLAPQLRIVSRAADVGAVDKLRRVGADAIVAPAEIGGIRLFAEMVRPEATTFLEGLLSEHGRGVHVQSVHIGKDSPLLGLTLAQANLRRRVGEVLVLATREAGTADFQPARADVHLRPGTLLIVMGDSAAIQGLRDLAGTRPLPTTPPREVA